MTAATNKDLLVSMIQTKSNCLVEAAFECLRRRMLVSNWPDPRGPTNGVQVKWLRKRGPARTTSIFPVKVDTGDVARMIETHEARAWTACVEAAAALVGNPFKAEVDLSGNSPLSTLAALNFGTFNRVIAFGVATPATDKDIVAVQEFFSARSQSCFLIEVTPASRPESLAQSLIRHGLSPIAERVAKCCRNVHDLPPILPSIEVRELSSSDREGWSADNTAAWGVPAFFGAWFGATLGREGFRHYGVFHRDLLVSTGAIYVTDDVAWSGFSATRPEHRGRGYQTATHIRRLHDAAAMGCNLVHTETAADTLAKPSPSLRNQIGVGFNRIYDKHSFAPVGNTQVVQGATNVGLIGRTPVN